MDLQTGAIDIDNVQVPSSDKATQVEVHYPAYIIEHNQYPTINGVEKVWLGLLKDEPDKEIGSNCVYVYLTDNVDRNTEVRYLGVLQDGQDDNYISLFPELISLIYRGNFGLVECKTANSKMTRIVSKQVDTRRKTIFNSNYKLVI